MKHRATPRFAVLAASYPPLRLRCPAMRARRRPRLKAGAGHGATVAPDQLDFHDDIPRTCNVSPLTRWLAFDDLNLTHLEFAIGLRCRDDDMLRTTVATMRIAEVFVIGRGHHVEECR